MKGFRSHHHPPSLDFFLAQHPKTYTRVDIREMKEFANWAGWAAP